LATEGLRSKNLTRPAETDASVVDEAMELAVGRCGNGFDRTGDRRLISDIEENRPELGRCLSAQGDSIALLSDSGKDLIALGVESEGDRPPDPEEAPVPTASE